MVTLADLDEDVGLWRNGQDKDKDKDMHCTSCGKYVHWNWNFCWHCGNPVYNLTTYVPGIANKVFDAGEPIHCVHCGIKMERHDEKLIEARNRSVEKKP